MKITKLIIVFGVIVLAIAVSAMFFFKKEKNMMGAGIKVLFYDENIVLGSHESEANTTTYFLVNRKANRKLNSKNSTWDVNMSFINSRFESVAMSGAPKTISIQKTPWGEMMHSLEGNEDGTLTKLDLGVTGIWNFEFSTSTKDQTMKTTILVNGEWVEVSRANLKDKSLPQAFSGSRVFTFKDGSWVEDIPEQ